MQDNACAKGHDEKRGKGRDNGMVKDGSATKAITRTLIIGGGAAGMAAAIAAGEQGQQVTVLERMNKTLKKVGVTGNGRGNLLNSGTLCYYGDVAFAAEVLSRMPYAQLASFLEGLGILLRQEEDGRIYPAALQASAAVDAMRLRAQQLGVQVAPLTRALSITLDAGGFQVDAEESQWSAPAGDGGRAKAPKKPVQTGVIPRKFRADRVIVTVGGAAAPAHGTDGSGYGLLTAFGHHLNPVRPALCALITDKRPLQGLSGQRAKARLTLTRQDGTLLHETRGEALFAEDGVSGIAAMQLARFVEPACQPGGLCGCRLRMDLRPALGLDGISEKALSILLSQTAEKRSREPISALMTGMMVPPLAHALMKAADIRDIARPISALNPSDMQRLACAISAFELEVTGVRGFESAQVTAGGIDPSDLDPATMESRLQKGLFAAGEVLDVDGDCGGFNLMFAFASGLLAGGAK